LRRPVVIVLLVHRIEPVPSTSALNPVAPGAKRACEKRAVSEKRKMSLTEAAGRAATHRLLRRRGCALLLALQEQLRSRLPRRLALALLQVARRSLARAPQDRVVHSLQRSSLRCGGKASGAGGALRLLFLRQPFDLR